MKIRAAIAADVAEVVALERGADRAPHWPETAYAHAVTEADRCLLVAEEDGVLVGFAVGSVAGDEGEVESVAVRLGARGRGTGRALVEAAVAWAREAGARAVMLEVRASSAGATRVYARAGFRQVGIRPGYYAGPEEDALVMRWETAESAVRAPANGLEGEGEA